MGVARVTRCSSLSRLQDKQGNSKERRRFKSLPVPQEDGEGWDGICSPLLLPVPSLQRMGRHWLQWALWEPQAAAVSWVTSPHHAWLEGLIDLLVLVCFP